MTRKDQEEEMSEDEEESTSKEPWFNKRDQWYGVAFGHYEDCPPPEGSDTWSWDQPRRDQGQMMQLEYSMGHAHSGDTLGWGDPWCRGRDLTVDFRSGHELPGLEWHYGRWVPG